jgi:hypothetical protein
MEIWYVHICMLRPNEVHVKRLELYIMVSTDLQSPNFPGVFRWEAGYAGPKPTEELHPHMNLRDTMTSVPKVYPGDAVFWHCVSVVTVSVRNERSMVEYINAGCCACS